MTTIMHLNDQLLEMQSWHCTKIMSCLLIVLISVIIPSHKVLFFYCHKKAFRLNPTKKNFGFINSGWKKEKKNLRKNRAYTIAFKITLKVRVFETFLIKGFLVDWHYWAGGHVLALSSDFLFNFLKQEFTLRKGGILYCIKRAWNTENHIVSFTEKK